MIIWETENIRNGFFWTWFSATGLLFHSSMYRSPIVDINVIYRALDPFNTEEGRQTVVHMGCTKFYIVPNSTFLQSNFLFSVCSQREKKMGQNVQAPILRHGKRHLQTEGGHFLLSVLLFGFLSISWFLQHPLCTPLLVI